MINTLNTVIDIFHNVDTLWMLLAFFVVSSAALLIAERFFGLAGLYAYIIVAIIVANLQVLKTTFFFGDTIALGTILFSSTFLCSDIINEHYGEKSALQGVKIGFYAYFLFALFMLFTLGFKPAPESLDTHQNMAAIFMPAPVIFMSSIVVYFVAQNIDIYLFSSLRQATQGRFLWVRTLVSTSIAMFIDNALFSLLVWHVFAVRAYTLDYIFWTYIVNVFILRAVLAIMSVPIMCLAKKPHQKD